MGDVRNWLRAAEALVADSRQAVDEVPASHREPPALDPLQKARQFVELYRRRNDLFHGLGADDIFADPAWHMLMDLYIAAQGNRRVSVSSLCIASLGPPTTALRHISILVEKGLLTRTPDPDDSRRVFIALSASALEVMNNILS